MPFSYFWGNPKKELEIVFDIGSHSFKGAAFEKIQGKNLPVIRKKKILTLPLFYDTKEVRFGMNRRIIPKLRVFIEDFLKEYGRHPHKIILSFSPHFVTTSIKNWQIQTFPYKRFIGPHDLKKYFEDLKKENTGQTGSEFYCLETSNNGYTIDFNKEVPRNIHLNFRVLSLVLPKELVDFVTETQRGLSGLKIEILPAVIAESEAIVKSLEMPNVFIIDLGGESTALTSVKNGSIVQLKSFPLGGRHFLRGIAKIGSVTMEDAEDLKRQYVQGLISNSKKVQIHDFLVHETKIWQKMFMESLEYFYAAGPLPPQILMTGGAAHLPELGTIIRGEDWIKNLSYVDYPKVNMVSAETIFEGDSLGGFLRGPEEFGLSALIYYAFNHG